MQSLPPALEAFGRFNQFIIYKLVASAKRPGKTDKFPADHATGAVVDAHDPRYWTDFHTAAAAASVFGEQYGVGFVFTDADPFWFLDIDGGYDTISGEWSEVARELCGRLAGVACEVSSSGVGLHLFGSGRLPEHSSKNEQLHLELYHTRRFVALTGVGAIGDAGLALPAETLEQIVSEYFPPRDRSEQDDEWWSDEPVAAWSGPDDDQELLERALRSASAASLLGGRARFADLWDGDPAVLAACYPPNDASSRWNYSAADAALAQHLAFWTGNNAQRIVNLMFKSGLVRDKWTERWPYYLTTTVRNACAMQKEWLQDAPEAPAPIVGVPTPGSPTSVAQGAPEAIVGSAYLMPEQQVSYFAGCTYVQDQHRVLLPNGTLAKPEQFKAIYGGRNFVMDAGNERTVRNAFEAFTESQALKFPRADTTCFRPKLPFGTILTEGGIRMVNTYLPIEVPRAKGDPGKFLQHIARLLPDARDQQIVIGYLAGCVQHQGVKFQWAPLLQGVEGNGKTMLFKAVARAIGKRYVHWPMAKDIDNTFNAWLVGHTFYAVDEIYVPEKRMDVFETLKQMVTGDEGIQVTKKGVDSTSQDICGNFGFLTNHLDGMRKSKNDRRVAPFFCAQQRREDLAETGLTESYFADLVDWFKGDGAYTGQAAGFDVVSEFLWTYSIPAEFDPALMVRAPHTSSTARAIALGLGTIEQHVQEAIEQAESRFRGGWVSTTGLADVIARSGHRLSPSKYGQVMERLGYVLHPGLENGRAPQTTLIDGNRPQLYVRRDSPAVAIANVNDILAAYVAAQKEGP